MRCLWLTLADPEPAVNGQFIYSGGLIRAAAAAGAELTVLGLSRNGRPAGPDEAGIDWQLSGEVRARSKLAKLLAMQPLITLHSASADLEKALDHHLATGAFDAVIFDSITLAWALPTVLRYRREGRLKLVYLAHNHEITVARNIAASATGLRRAGLALDALKVWALERRLVQQVDLVTANAPADCDEFSAMRPRRPVLFLPPGYGGPRVAARQIDEGVPRRAVVVGSFNFPPKRASLEAFLEAAHSRFSAAGVELQVVGGAEEAYLDSMRRRFPTIEFTGSVPDVRPFMANARVALVPDLLGGFKLKALDYVFNRLPIFAMSIAIPGMPLENGRSVHLFDSHRDMAEGVIAEIDRLPGLNLQQELAFQACADCFSWNVIGRTLLDHVRSCVAPGRAVREARMPAQVAQDPAR